MLQYMPLPFFCTYKNRNHLTLEIEIQDQNLKCPAQLKTLKRSLHSIRQMMWASNTAAELQLSALHLNIIWDWDFLYQSPDETLLKQTQRQNQTQNLKFTFKVKPSQHREVRISFSFSERKLEHDPCYGVTAVSEMIANCGIKCNTLKHLHEEKKMEFLKDHYSKKKQKNN